MFEWEEADRFSFDDSDRFEEDSICSWISEPESVVNNWRGWRRNNPSNHSNAAKRQQSDERTVMSLSELAAREVAASIPFELVEHYYPPVPEPLQLRIAFWSFPEQEEDIRLYSCLANGSADEFVKGEHMLKIKGVRDPLQIGFHLSATVTPGSDKTGTSTSVTFDRKKIISCQCSCSSNAVWCSHVVALCLHRIHYPMTVKLRAPVSESLSRLGRDQLQKFAQYLIAESPQQILTTAQKILDQLLSPEPSEIKSVSGAPDPTAGSAASDQTSWCLDDKNLRDNVKKILIKFCVPAPIVFSDVNYLSTTAPPSASEWCSFLRPLRGREPEGMWNLLSIVREMYRRNDRNSIPLLEVITQQCLETAQIMVWWFNTKVALHHKGSTGKQVNSNSQASQNACASLCDEIVTLWKLAALNPCMSPKERHLLKERLMGYHVAVIEKIQANQSTNSSSSGNGVSRASGSRSGKPSDLELFSGFKSAIEACTLDWDNDPIDGITFGHNSHYLCPFAVFKLKEGCEQSQVNSSQAVLRCEYPGRPRSVDLSPSNKASSSREPVSRQDSGNVDGASGNQQPSSFSSSEEAVSDEGVGDESSQPMSNQFESGNEDEEEELQQQELQASGNGQQNHPVNPEENREPGGYDPADVNQYQVYFYDSKDLPSSQEGTSSGSASGPSRIDIFKKLRTRIEDEFEIKLMRAEGLHAHGFFAEACDLAVYLANKMLENPPNLLPPAETQPASVKSKRKKGSVSAASHALTHKTSTTLSHCAFLCTVLTENSTHHHLAFQIGMFGLELARPPASTKPMEVKLAHQESELVGLLKRIPLGPRELSVLRDRALQLRDGSLKSRGEALLPLMLASYLFESLVISQNGHYRLLGDEVLGFDAAVAAIGLKAHVSEAEHPLLCEGTRRQRGDLALLLLVHYKDHPDRLAKIMDRLLDKEIHQLFRSPILPSYYATGSNRNHHHILNANHLNSVDQQAMREMEQQFAGVALVAGANGAVPRRPAENSAGANGAQRNVTGSRWNDWDSLHRGEGGPPQVQQATANQRAQRSASQDPTENNFWQRNVDTPSSNHSLSLAQGPGLELARNFERNSNHRAGPGSDSGSSGNSSADSIESSSSSNRLNGLPGPIRAPGESEEHLLAVAPLPLPVSFPSVTATAAAGPLSTSVVTSAATPSLQQAVNEMTNMVRPTLPNIKVTRFKGKRAYPSLPNQPSEASAHFMFELAKQVLTKAGGNSSTSLFTQPVANQNHRPPHRALHMCAFQIGLFALGLHNRVSPNWLSRTYSSHVSWIIGQAMEIGAFAINLLVDIWEGHLTPPEAASMADKASKARDESMIVAASELALSVLPHAGALNPNEIQRAIQQCKEQSNEMLEKACLAVEKAAAGGGVYPEVMFEVARHWHHLFEKYSVSSMNEAVPEELSPPQDQVVRSSGPSGQSAPVVTAFGLVPPPTTSATGHTSYQAPPPHPLIPLPFPLYGVIPGFQNGAAAPPVHMYAVAPPPTALHLAAVANANSNPTGVPMFPPSNQYNVYHLPHFYSNPPVSQAQLAAASYQTQAAALLGAGLPHQIAFNHGALVSHQAHQGIDGHLAGGVNVSASPAHGAHQHAGGQRQQAAVQRYLTNAYRVGMLALEALGRKISEDRPQMKFARNPSYGDDVKWLFSIAKKLGVPHIQNFLMGVVNTVVSPFLLQDLAYECAKHLVLSQSFPPVSSAAYNNIVHQIRSQPYLTQLVNRCYQTYYQCIHQRLYHVTPNDYDDFALIVVHAKRAFQWTQEGLNAYQQLLQSIKRSKHCKKELWSKLLNVNSSATDQH